MQVERVFYPVKTLGPGKRIGIWTIGCPHGCFRCCNPELWMENPNKVVTVDTLIRLIEEVAARSIVNGVTISGGDPFVQPTELAEFVSAIRRSVTDDILVYTGYTLNQLIDMRNPSVDTILANIAVLIDGKYIHHRNDNRPLRGSSNQQIHVLNSAYQSLYDEYLRLPRQVQNVFYGQDLLTVGIPMMEEERP